MGIVNLSEVPERGNSRSSKYTEIFDAIQKLRENEAYEVDTVKTKNPAMSITQALTHKKLNNAFKVVQRSGRVFIVKRSK